MQNEHVDNSAHDHTLNDTQHFRFRNGLYVLTIALTAACGLVVEIVAGRILAPYLGMSLYTWTAIIAVVLAGFSLGHWVGGLLADRSNAKNHNLVAWTLIACAFSCVASLVLIRLVSGPILQLGLNNVPTIILLTSVLFFLPSFIVGIPSPILTKIAITDAPERTGRTLGTMYAAGAFGSIIGTLLAGFVFIPWLGSIGTVLLVALTYFVLGLAFLATQRTMNTRQLAILLVCGFAGVGSVAFVGQKTNAFTTACTKESAYYCIRIVDLSSDVGTPAKLMVLDHLGHGINLKSQPDRFLSSYVELTDILTLLHLNVSSRPKAFFVGGGAYTLPRAWLTRKPAASVTVSEIDPMVTHLAMQDMWLSPSPHLNVVHEDARRKLNSYPDERYDVIVGDAFHDIAVPQHLITLEFFQLVKARLRADGFYVMTAVDKARSPALMLSVAKTLKRVFPVVEIWLDNEQQSGGERSTFILYAGKQATPHRSLRSPRTPRRGWRRWSEQRIEKLSARLGPIILTDDFAPVDRLIRAQ